MCVEAGSGDAAAGVGSRRSMREASPAPPPPLRSAGSGGPLPPPDSPRARKRRRSESPPALLSEDARRADRQVPPGTSVERLLLRAVAAACAGRPSAWQPSFELGFALRELDRLALAQGLSCCCRHAPPPWLPCVPTHPRTRVPRLCLPARLHPPRDWRRRVCGHSLVDLLAVLEHRGHVALQRLGGALCFRPSVGVRLPPALPPAPATSPAPGQQAPAGGGGQGAAAELLVGKTEAQRARQREDARQWEEAMPRGGALEAQLLDAVRKSGPRGQAVASARVSQQLAASSRRCACARVSAGCWPVRCWSGQPGVRGRGPALASPTRPSAAPRRAGVRREWRDRGLPGSLKFGASLWELDRRGLALTECRRAASGAPDIFVSLRRE